MCLIKEGWDVTHVASLGLRSASDRVVLQAARDDGRVLVSADTDFGMLLANLSQVEEHLRLRSIVVIGDSLRVRRLPIG
jgi:predicted nuclease of predicted toxin-antitoxin system